MKMISKKQIQNLYAIAAKNDLVENGNKEDEFHLLVKQLTGQTSVSKLTENQFYLVKNRILNLNKVEKNIKKDEIKSNKYGNIVSKRGLTKGQASKIWFLMYEFANYSPSKATVGQRLKGIIKRQLNIDVDVKNPFLWLDYHDGNKLIEILKKYVHNAEGRHLGKMESIN